MKHTAKTFADVPEREWALSTPEALFLKSNLPESIWENLKVVFLKKIFMKVKSCVS